MPALILVSLLWAFTFGLNKRFLSDADPFAVSALRLIFAWFALLPWWRPRLLSFRGKFLLTAIGAVQFGAMYAALYSCYRFFQAWQIALLTLLTPLWVVLFSDLLDRRFSPRFWGAAFLSCAGAALADGSAWTDPALARGFWAVQFANICFAAGQVAWSRWRRARGPEPSDLSVFCWPLLGGALVAAMAVALWGREGAFAFSPAQTGMIIFLGVVPSGLAFLLWNRAASRVTPGALASANNLKAPLAVLVSLTVFGEWASLGDKLPDIARLLAGLALILAALRWAVPPARPPEGETLARR